MSSLTLFRYIAIRLLASVGGLFLAFTTLIMVIDLIENLRFAGKYADGSFLFALKVTFLRALSLTQILSPFLFLFGALWCFNQLNRRSEISVMRSAGLSIWRVLLPAGIVSGLIGIFLITLIDPISTKMMAQSEKLKNDIRGKRTSLVQFFNDGIWLRQSNADGSLIINAKSINQDQNLLGSVTIWNTGLQAEFLERFDAPEAIIKDNSLLLRYPSIRTPNSPIARKSNSYELATNLSIKDFNEQVASPETISIWNLSRFIHLAEAAGLSTTSYYLRFHDLISTPLKLIGMVLIAAAFSMRPTRLGGTLKLVLFSIASGFTLYMVTAISTALGESGTVPLVMAAWGPAVVATLFAITGILHLEDG